MRPISRIDPAMPAHAYKTYAIVAPKQTHTRKATCAEVECQHHIHGWVTTVIRGSDDEALIRRAGRHFVEEPAEANMVRFVFPPGQPCFRVSTHRVTLEREPLYVVRDGDWRGNPRGTDPRRHTRAADWVDDFATHQDKLATRLAQG